MAWLRLVRWKNLLIVALTQLVVWVCIDGRVTALVGAARMVLTPGLFVALCLSTLFIAAGGYVINDYFDVEIDAINRPDKKLLSSPGGKRRALILYWILNGMGFAAGLVAALGVGRPYLLLYQLACAWLLWNYSSHLKRRFLAGNLAVVAMTMVTVIIVGNYEKHVNLGFLGTWTFLKGYFGQQEVNPVYVLGATALFAGLMTWLREIVKDLEDAPGDAAAGASTMAIVWGPGRTVRFVKVIALLTSAVLLGIAGVLFRGRFPYTALYLALIVSIPLLIWTLRFSADRGIPGFARASSHLKLLMLAGIVSLIVLLLETESNLVIPEV